MRIVIVGPMPPRVSSASNPVGGAAVNFAETVRQLRKRGFDLDLVDMSRHRVNIPRWLGVVPQRDDRRAHRMARSRGNEVQHAALRQHYDRQSGVAGLRPVGAFRDRRKDRWSCGSSEVISPRCTTGIAA